MTGLENRAARLRDRVMETWSPPRCDWESRPTDIAQTASRRQCSPRSWPFDLSKARADDGFYKLAGIDNCQYLHVPFHHPEEPGGFEEGMEERWYPQWEPGDRIWCRETWSPVCEFDPEEMGVFYRATYQGDAGNVRWKPSIHMPRWAARLVLEVTEVRAQRLQDITEEDARAEGVKAFQRDDSSSRWIDPFVNLWVRINGEGSFDANPWVWAVSFKKVSNS